MSEIPTTSLEKASLEAHVDLCALRYQHLEERLSKVEVKIDNIAEEMKVGNSSLIKVVVGSTATIIAGLISALVVAMMHS